MLDIEANLDFNNCIKDVLNIVNKNIEDNNINIIPQNQYNQLIILLNDIYNDFSCDQI